MEKAEKAEKAEGGRTAYAAVAATVESYATIAAEKNSWRAQRQRISEDEEESVLARVYQLCVGAQSTDPLTIGVVY